MVQCVLPPVDEREQESAASLPSSDRKVDITEEITSRKQGRVFIFPAISRHLERLPTAA